MTKTPQKPTDDLRETIENLPILIQVRSNSLNRYLAPKSVDDFLALLATQTAQNSGLASKATPKVSGNQSDNPVERLREIIGIAHDLKWITPHQNTYPLMQLSEVEKCMLAMVDGRELTRMRDWATDVAEGRIIPQADAALTDLQPNKEESDANS